MSAEEEIKAMGAVSAALQGLEDEGRARVLMWAMSHYKVGGGNFRYPWDTGPTTEPQRSASNCAFETFAELFDAASPSTEKDKAMVAAYWLQICENAGSFQAQSLNDLLKHLGLHRQHHRGLKPTKR